VKILVVSDYLHQGGAAIACERLCLALKEAGADVHRFSFLGSGHEKSGVPHTAGNGARLEGFLSLAFSGQNPPTRRRLSRNAAFRRLRRTIATFKPDVINLHNLHGAEISVPQILPLVAGCPVIWTLHDMWSFTGRCAYAGDCSRFLVGCTAECPTPAEYPALAPTRIAGAWHERAQFLSRSAPTAAACPSRWLADEARRGLWKNLRVEAVSNALPLDLFFPVPKAAARAALGLPADTRFALLAADYLAERRKGGDLIQAALAEVHPAGWEVLLLGHDGNIPLPGWRRRPLGYVKDDHVKRLIYSAADVLLHPAPTDNLPNTVAEALACGTPVAAFKIGGVPEMVLPGVTGWLSETITSKSYAGCLDRAFADLALGTDFSVNCRLHAKRLFSPPDVAAAYLNLAAALIGSSPNERTKS
jgi:glycosyltransferase involved in cell wall biosynthesis